MPNLVIKLSVDGAAFEISGDVQFPEAKQLVTDWIGLVRETGVIAQGRVDKLADRIHNTTDRLEDATRAAGGQ